MFQEYFLLGYYWLKNGYPNIRFRFKVIVNVPYMPFCVSAQEIIDHALTNSQTMEGNGVISKNAQAVVDDHHLIRDGIAALLSDMPNIQVAAFASTGEKAILLAKKHKPNVILMDIQMSAIGGIAAIQKIVALTLCTQEAFPTNILKAGAQGYLTKGAKVELILLANQEGLIVP
jgi:CheY-like chemotaxis protein